MFVTISGSVCQAKVDATYKDKHLWCKLSIQAASSMACPGKQL